MKVDQQVKCYANSLKVPVCLNLVAWYASSDFYLTFIFRIYLILPPMIQKCKKLLENLSTRQLIILVAILVLLGILLFLSIDIFVLSYTYNAEDARFSQHLPTEPSIIDFGPNIHFGIVIDCGSSGSRVFIYFWPPHSGNPSDLLNIQQLMDPSGKPVVKKITPGKNVLED